MTTSTYCLSLVWVSMVLMSPYTVSSKSLTKEESQGPTLCFLEGMNAANSTTTNCDLIELSPELSKIYWNQVDQCLMFSKYGCQYGLDKLFCQVGISHALTNSSCSPVEVGDDLVFDCCLRCRDDLRASKKDNCDVIENMGARYRTLSRRYNIMAWKNPEVHVELSSVPGDIDLEAESFTKTSIMVCNEGYRWSNASKECEDVNECEEDEGKCRENENCFNVQGSHRCCPLGTEVPDGESECTYIDQCARSPCMTIDYCVNYFTDRLCEDKTWFGYRFVKGNEGIMELIDKSESAFLYLELTKQEITLKGDRFDRLGLINLRVPNDVRCHWSLYHEPYAPSKDDELQEDQFIRESKPNVFKVWLTGRVKPQSAIIMVTCVMDYKKLYKNTIYFTFNPESKIVRNGNSN